MAADIGDVEEIDLGWDEIVASLLKEGERKPVADVGVVGASAAEEHDGPTNVDLASMHEFGGKDGRPPERSFIRSTVTAKRRSYDEIFSRGAKLVYERKTDVDTILGLVGSKSQSDVRATIRAGIEPELAESTQAAKERAGKAGSTPLIDTGQLINSITYIVRKEGDEL